MTALLAAPVDGSRARRGDGRTVESLSAQIDVLKEAKELQNKRIEALESQVRDLQAQLSKPSGNYASADDLKHGHGRGERGR